MTILIPAYEPCTKLIGLIRQIKDSCTFSIVVVDDGSGPEYSGIFREAEMLGCRILTHKVNMGKGRALKTGFRYIAEETGESDGVVTADADGQHLVPDIISVASQVLSGPGSIVLGERKFTGRVPVRSIFGNTVTRLVFALASGQSVRDTQTGLRGFSVSILPWLQTVEGERFEYEMNMLLRASSDGISLRKVDISTVYLEGNKSSHFRTVRDSLLVYLPILKFCLSSLCGAAVDYLALFAFARFFHSLFIAVVGARLLSSAANYTINRFYVFSHGGRRQKAVHTAAKYYALVCLILVSNYLILSFLSYNCRVGLFWSKLLTEVILFMFSYTMQHLFVFNNRYGLVKSKVKTVS